MFYLVSAALLVGVALASFISVSVATLWATLFVAAALIIVSFVVRAQNIFIIVALCICAAALGMARMESAKLLQEPALEVYLGSTVELSGIVCAEPDARETSQRITLCIDGSSAKAIFSIERFADVAYDGHVVVSGVLEHPEAFETDNGRTFRYDDYLSKDGIGYQLARARLVSSEPSGARSVRGELFALKHWYEENLARALPEPHAALAGGITVGNKRALGGELLEQFRTTGIVHIVVLSGYNVMIIAIAILWMLSWLPLIAGLMVSALMIALFALMVGGGASVVRASTMAILALIARATGRTYAVVRALMLVIVGMVVWSPHVLIYDPGFQLSVIATLGIIFLAPLIEERLLWMPKFFALREIAAATIGTQLAVLPLLLWQMGLLSVVALPTNMMVLPIIPVAMFLSFVAGMLGFVGGSAAALIGAPAYALLALVLSLVEWAAALPFAAVSVPPFPAWIMLAAYVLGTLWIWRVYRRREQGGKVNRRQR